MTSKISATPVFIVKISRESSTIVNLMKTSLGKKKQTKSQQKRLKNREEEESWKSMSSIWASTCRIKNFYLTYSAISSFASFNLTIQTSKKQKFKEKSCCTMV